LICKTLKNMMIIIFTGVLCLLILFYYLYRFIKKHSDKNIVEIDFRKEDGKVKGYRKDKNGSWIYDETLYLRKSTISSMI